MVHGISGVGEHLGEEMNMNYLSTLCIVEHSVYFQTTASFCPRLSLHFMWREHRNQARKKLY